MTAMEVPHRIVTGAAQRVALPGSPPQCQVLQPAGCAGGNLTRQEGQDRIDFLAQARNLALEVLWLNGSAAGMDVAAEVGAPRSGFLHACCCTAPLSGLMGHIGC